MEVLNNKKNIKIICLILVVITITNVIMPHYVYAVSEDEKVGGKLFKPIAKLFCSIGDIFISFLQKIFMGSGDIKGEGIKEIEEGSYLIRYSPAIIFSNQVPALDANFISPMTSKEAEKAEINYIEVETNIQESKLISDYGLDPVNQNFSIQAFSTDDEWYDGINIDKDHLVYRWTYNDKEYVAVCTKEIPGIADKIGHAALGLLASGGNILWRNRRLV